MGKYQERSTKLKRAEVTADSPVRLLVKYRGRFVEKNGAHLYKGNIKIYVPWKFQLTNEYDQQGLIDRVVLKNKSEFHWAWLMPNGIYGFTNVLRAWNDNGIELSEPELKVLNQRRFFKHQNRSKQR